MVWLPSDKKNLMLCLFVLTEFTNVRDTHRTPHNDIGRTFIASHDQKSHLKKLVPYGD